MTPIKPGRMPLLKLNCRVMDKIPRVTQTLRDLELIHFARWSIIDEIPYNGPPQEREELRYRYLFFQSNFNGSWDEYIDAFSYLVRMWPVWGSSFGYSGVKPVVRFKEYIQRNEYVASHYYSAYPEATTRMITAALDLKERFEAFDQRIDGQSPEEFAAAFREFVTDVQRLL